MTPLRKEVGGREPTGPTITRPADAWRDLMTMHRLGRLVVQGCFLVEYLSPTTKTVDGYRLYLVGPNEQDEDGRSVSDNPPGDDIAVQMKP